MSTTSFSAAAPVTRRVRAYFAPVNRAAQTPVIFDPAQQGSFSLDAPPVPWISLGYIQNFKRKSAGKIASIATGIPAAPLEQVRASLDAEVSFQFLSWTKLTMALATGSQHMNVLAPASGASPAAVGAQAVGAVVPQSGSTSTSIALASTDAAQFSAGQIIAVDADYTGQTGFVGAPVAEPTARGATITWTTDEPATSYVEYGTSTLGAVQGDGVLATSHAVTLSGLSELTGYAFRVRSSDALRNVAISATSSFSTASASAPPAPVLVAQPDAIWEEGTQPASYPATFSWSAVQAPDGHAVQYRFQLATAPSFAAPLADVWLDGTTAQQTFPVNAFPGATYYWRVQARDAVEPAAASPWAPAQSFRVYWYTFY